MNKEVNFFVKTSESPALGQAEGVAITVLPKSDLRGYRLHGVCRASVKTAESLKDTILHNVAIIITRGPNFVPLAFPMTGDRVVFSDDIQINGEYHTAYFNLDLDPYGISPETGTFYVLASFHTFLSEIIKMKGGEKAWQKSNG